jgi:hypothetical protein
MRRQKLSGEKLRRAKERDISRSGLDYDTLAKARRVHEVFREEELKELDTLIRATRKCKFGTAHLRALLRLRQKPTPPSDEAAGDPVIQQEPKAGSGEAADDPVMALAKKAIRGTWTVRALHRCVRLSNGRNVRTGREPKVLGEKLEDKRVDLVQLWQLTYHWCRWVKANKDSLSGDADDLLEKCKAAMTALEIAVKKLLDPDEPASGSEGPPSESGQPAEGGGGAEQPASPPETVAEPSTSATGAVPDGGEANDAPAAL